MVGDAEGRLFAAEERQVDHVLDLGPAGHQVVDVVGRRFSVEGGGIQGVVELALVHRQGPLIDNRAGHDGGVIHFLGGGETADENARVGREQRVVGQGQAKAEAVGRPRLLDDVEVAAVLRQAGHA